MIPVSPFFFARPPAGLQPFDIFTFAPTLDVLTDSTSFRCIIAGFPRGGAHLRVFMASALGLNGLAAHLKVNHVSVGKLITGAYSQPNTQAVPVPLLFAGAAAFDLNVGQVIESDEIAFTFAPSDKLVLTFDAAGATYAAGANAVPSTEMWQGAASYNKATVTGFTRSSASVAAFVRIGAR